MCHLYHCPLRISINILGNIVEGCLKDKSWLEKINIQCYHSSINPSIYINLPFIRLEYIENVCHGSCGYIDTGIYQTSSEKYEVYIKKPIIVGQSLLYEAFIQHVIQHSLCINGFPMGAPYVVDIFKLQNQSICFAMKPIPGISLCHLLESVCSDSISHIIIECILQLIAMIWHLNNYLGINHRDLTPSNLLIIEHNTSQQKILHIDSEQIVISSKYSITLIDFGFCCGGSIDNESPETYISLSTIYPLSDQCPKEGRDLFIFIGLFYIEYHHKFNKYILDLFELWLENGSISRKLCQFMKKDKENSKKWLYFIAGNDKITKFYCSPIQILRDLRGFHK